MTSTPVPPEGLDLLIFQVRWLDRAPEQPVACAVALHAESAGTEPPTKWEDHQTRMFDRLQPDRPPDGARAGAIKPGTLVQKNIAIAYSDTYFEVPVVQLLTQEDVITDLIEPSLSDQDRIR